MTAGRDASADGLPLLLERRSNFLRALVQQGRDKPGLVDALDASRSTIDRGLRELASEGLVTRRDGVYEATLAGRCALEMYDRCVRTLGGVREAQDLLSMLPADAPIDPVFFDGAAVYTPSPDMPDGVLDRLFASIEDAETLLGVAPVALVRQLEPFYDAATAGGTDVEMVVANDLFEKLLASPDSRSVIADQLGDENVHLYRADVPFGFGLWVVDDEAGILVYTETGVGGVALNDGEAAVEWATDTFESIRRGATLVTLSSLPD